jgi:hypothetical protein
MDQLPHDACEWILSRQVQNDYFSLVPALHRPSSMNDPGSGQQWPKKGSKCCKPLQTRSQLLDHHPAVTQMGRTFVVRFRKIATAIRQIQDRSVWKTLPHVGITLLGNDPFSSCLAYVLFDYSVRRENQYGGCPNPRCTPPALHASHPADNLLSEAPVVGRATEPSMGPHSGSAPERIYLKSAIIRERRNAGLREVERSLRSRIFEKGCAALRSFFIDSGFPQRNQMQVDSLQQHLVFREFGRIRRRNQQILHTNNS